MSRQLLSFSPAFLRRRAGGNPLAAYAAGGKIPPTVLDFSLDKYLGTVTALSDLTFARASDATYIDADGLLQTASSNVPRFDYATGARRLLIEPTAATNYEISSASGSFLSYTGCTGASGQADPNGGTEGRSVIPTATTAVHYASFSSAGCTTSGLSGNMTISAWISLRGSQRYVGLGFSAGAFASSSRLAMLDVIGLASHYNEAGVTSGVLDMGGGFYRIWVSAPIASGQTFSHFLTLGDGTAGVAIPTYLGNVNDGVVVWGMQVENSAVPTSYISTAGATATRAAETLALPAAKIASYTTAVCFAMSGEMTYADRNVADEVNFFNWPGSAGNAIAARLDTRSAATGKFDAIQGSGAVYDESNSASNAYAPGVNVPFSIATRHGSTFIQGATGGVASTANNTPTNIADLSAYSVGIATIGGPIRIEKFVMWNEDIGQTGLEEASA